MYEVTYEMAVDLLKFYAEELHIAERNKTISPTHLETWTSTNNKFHCIVKQLIRNGDDVNSILKDIENDILTYNYNEILVMFDGAARGNHDINELNKSAIAYIVYADGKEIHRYSEYIGSHLDTMLGNRPYQSVATVNVCEYYGLIKSLEYLVENNIIAPKMIFRSDSECVVNQVNLVHATRSPHLLLLRNYALELLRNLPNYKIEHVKREYNKLTDKMVNVEIDNNIS